MQKKVLYAINIYSILKLNSVQQWNFSLVSLFVLQKPSAAAASASNLGVKGSPASFSRKRFQKELEKITRDPPSHCSGGLVGNDNFEWQGTIIDPADTPLKGGVSFLSACFHRDYLHKSPKLEFLTKANDHFYGHFFL
ncbi:hypothetical protein NE237_011389 [Protea cynaroides]|uniref:UBC core domain-containing protein n=1 Tax=Protea cynaroides TaxID=273540 RepID=A0A9Q0GUV1_9MAGN|nr:hypothetical protein NE237_011389 [Protea cynaroides]